MPQGALSPKEAKVWCHVRTVGDGRAGQAPECCVLLPCHSWSTGWDGSCGCWGVFNLPWCPLPALPVRVMAVHHQGRAVLQAAVCERHPGLAEPRALKEGSQKADRGVL